MDWTIILFVLKWIFLGLVYGFLVLLLIGVQREMRTRVPVGEPETARVYGRLRVVRTGTDPRLRQGAVLQLNPETTIGSQPDNDLVLRDRYISGHHTRLHWDGISWWVDDMNSTNGTYVNQQRISPGAPAALAAGAMLQVGDVMLEMLE